MANHTGLNFCRRCGNSLAGRTKFCGHCGTPIMSTALPAKTNHPIHGVLAVLGIGVLLTGAYLRWHTSSHFGGKAHNSASNVAHGSESPFLYPDPPADLITMLQRGDTNNDPIPLPRPAQAIVMKDLCHVILTDYPPNSYAYGPTRDAAQQTQVEREAEDLVEQVSALFTDKAQARHQAELALAWQASDLYEQRQLDPGQACHMIKPLLDSPTIQALF